MYNFINTNEIGEQLHSSIQTIFNGVNIDINLEGFRTLAVSGRGLLSKNINSTDIPGTDGKYFLYGNLEVRAIVVKFQLKATTNEEFRKKFNKLNMLLQTDEPKILKFTDEPDYSYKAILQKGNDIEETSNSVVSTFTFLCLDPYKYKAVDKDTGVNNVTITKLPNNRNEFTPELIKVIVNSVSDKVIIKNQTTTKKIIINHNSFAVGDVLEIDLNKDYPLKLNTTVRSELIDFVESDFDFTVKQGDVITCSNSRVLEIHTKERMY
jgi:predicted phage tail component-like protein